MLLGAQSNSLSFAHGRARWNLTFYSPADTRTPSGVKLLFCSRGRNRATNGERLLKYAVNGDFETGKHGEKLARDIQPSTIYSLYGTAVYRGDKEKKEARLN